MEHASNQDKSAFATEPVGRLIVKFAIPCVISLVVNALYNIVDQIFIGWGVGYLGNGATNVVFPITIIALALAVLIGDGGAAYLSLKLGEGDLDSVKKGVGNAAVMITIAGIAMLVINTVFDSIFIFIFDMGVRGAAIATILGQIISFLVSIFYLPRFKTFHFDRSALRLHKRVCLSVLSLGVSSFITQIAITIVMALFNNLLAVYGAASVYGSEIPLTAMGIVMKVNQIMLSILVGIAIGAQPVIGFNYGCKNFHRVKRAFEVAIAAAEIIAIIAFFIFQFAPMSVVSIFGSEEGLYNEFAVKCFRIFLMLCPLNGFQTVAAIYLQAIGKPIKSAVVTLSRQIVFLVPVALLLPKAMGVVGVLWAGSAADALAFILALAMIVYEMKKLKKMAA
ncbi:MATE family efflux transporter [Butyricicoccus pullicaecorum]|uniref:MATE family efflux transporter n=1 Tax=Butyricicoccus pullicaecorum TaxID=501571 RepID=A0A1Y4LP81_9FIRM|nr:MATE family efflux transporter [Butyricicoccus pullicaecorum]OUP58483.1 MATE family efflux transporter [Butyricicoccus pullicaecorum]